MYATIRVYRVKGDKSKELDQIVTEDFLPIVSHLPGYVAYFAIDQGDGKWASMSFFTSEADAKASTKAAREFQWCVRSLIESGPDITTGVIAAVGPSKFGAAGLEEPAQLSLINARRADTGAKAGLAILWCRPPQRPASPLSVSPTSPRTWSRRGDRC